MKLRDLTEKTEILDFHADPETEITGIQCDSRKIEPGNLFAAIAGFAADGNRFIPMAREKGAAVTVTARRPEEDIPYILVKSDRLALAQMSAAFYGYPAESMKMVGVTGTNGKTSITLLLKHVLEKAAGAKVGLIGTMETCIGDQILPSERTTPESLELQQLFARMRDAGCSHVLMEVSSHAIALDRVGGIHYDAAAFTNLTEDHLDFHKTMDAYCDTKAKLFSRCDAAVMNRDDAYFPRMQAAARCPVLTVSETAEGDLRAEDIVMRADGVRFTAVYKDERVPVSLGIPGKFTVYNAMTVLGLATELGVSLPAAAAALADAPGVKGRVEVVPTPGKPYTVLIDYAHSPDSLENVLSSVRGFCRGRLIAVFGCGGNRDAEKRPIMGKIGTDLADYAIITSDNPRNEVPEEIIAQIVKGISPDRKNYEVIENRPAAIRRAMDIGRKDDIIILAGKGHETYQEIRGVKHHLDEREVVAAYLK